MTSIATTPDAVESKPMGVPRVNLGRIAAHLALLFFVVLWTFPTVGLLISSVRDKDQLALTGWWTSLAHSTLMAAARPDTADKAVQDGSHWVIKGNLFGRAKGQQIETFGPTNADIGKNTAGSSIPMQDGGTITVEANGDYVWSFDQQPTFKGAPRIYYVTGSPPRFTLENYARVLGSTGVAESFVNSLTVAIPSTVMLPPSLIGMVAPAAYLPMSALVGPKVSICCPVARPNRLPLITQWSPSCTALSAVSGRDAAIRVECASEVHQPVSAN
jgi:alpha-glucoside transport system permease protein